MWRILAKFKSYLENQKWTVINGSQDIQENGIFDNSLNQARILFLIDNQIVLFVNESNDLFYRGINEDFLKILFCFSHKVYFPNPLDLKDFFLNLFLERSKMFQLDSFLGDFIQY